MKRTVWLVLALLVPAALAAQDSTHHAKAHRSARASHYQSSAGSVELRSALSHDEISQLQDALKSDGCDAGPVDGVLGPRTRQAMACGRRKLGIDSSDPNELFRALNLNFSAPTSRGMGGVERSGRNPRSTVDMRDSTMMHPDTGMTSGSTMSHHMEAKPGRRHGDSTRVHRTRTDTTGMPSADRPHASIPRQPRPDTTRPPR